MVQEHQYLKPCCLEATQKATTQLVRVTILVEARNKPAVTLCVVVLYGVTPTTGSRVESGVRTAWPDVTLGTVSVPKKNALDGPKTESPRLGWRVQAMSREQSPIKASPKASTDPNCKSPPPSHCAPPSSLSERFTPRHFQSDLFPFYFPVTPKVRESATLPLFPRGSSSCRHTSRVSLERRAQEGASVRRNEITRGDRIHASGSESKRQQKAGTKGKPLTRVHDLSERQASLSIFFTHRLSPRAFFFVFLSLFSPPPLRVNGSRCVEGTKNPEKDIA